MTSGDEMLLQDAGFWAVEDPEFHQAVANLINADARLRNRLEGLLDSGDMIGVANELSGGIMPVTEALKAFNRAAVRYVYPPAVSAPAPHGIRRFCRFWRR